MPQYLMSTSLNEMLQARLKNPELEEEYRRGFGDGVGALFQELDSVPALLTRSELTEAIWRWWQKLMAWQQGEPDDSAEPPAFTWKEQSSGMVDSGVSPL